MRQFGEFVEWFCWFLVGVAVSMLIVYTAIYTGLAKFVIVICLVVCAFLGWAIYNPHSRAIALFASSAIVLGGFIAWIL